MTAPAKIRAAVGYRSTTVFELDANGFPKAPSTSVYEGLTVTGVDVLTINHPEARQIVHMGDDRVFALDVLPPGEPITGEISVAKINDTLDALLGGVKAAAVGEANILVVGSDQQGNEPMVGMLAYQQALDEDNLTPSTNLGARNWNFALSPRTFAILREGGMDANAAKRTYALRPQFFTKHLWGVALSLSTEGATQGQLIRGVTQYKPKVVAFKGDGATTVFNLPTASPAAATGKVTTWNNGTIVTSGLTVTTTSLTFSVAPASGNIVVVFYEW